MDMLAEPFLPVSDYLLQCKITCFISLRQKISGKNKIACLIFPLPFSFRGVQSEDDQESYREIEEAELDFYFHRYR